MTTGAVATRTPPTRMSIERKLPLTIGTLLLLSTTTLSVSAYLSVRRNAYQRATEQLSTASTQLSERLRTQSAQIRATVVAAHEGPAIIEYARSRNQRLRAQALVELARAGSQLDVVSELRDSSGDVLMSTGENGLAVDAADLRDILPNGPPGDSAATGKLRLAGGIVIYPVTVVVRGAPAYRVHWRRVAGSRQNREFLTQLVGSQATLFMGNADASQWSDLERAVPGPPVRVVAPPSTAYLYERDGQRYFGVGATIPGTPWAAMADFPLNHVRAPMATFANLIIPVAVLTVALGLLGTWLISRRITQPLRDLTTAADAITADQPSTLPTPRGTDEVGRLAQAFGTMAAEVGHARRGLEHVVAERTRDLNEALGKLRNANDALVQRERLAMLGQLSSGVSHELRSPLGVMGNAVYYLKTVLAGAPKNVHEYLDVIQQQVTISEKLVGDLLDFVRSKPPRRQPILLREAIDAQVSRLGRPEGLNIETRLPVDLPPVLVDGTQLGQILLNLLANAAQAVEGPGRVTVSAHCSDGEVRVDVTDSGLGVPPENLEKIFEPLFTTKVRGIGLGLTVARTLARANGGDLAVRSPAGQGATFRLSLPKAPAIRPDTVSPSPLT